MKKPSLAFIAFLQALGLTLYSSLIGLLIWKAEVWFGPPFFFLGPALFLALFIASALICALIGLGYPIFLFWDKKQTRKSLKLVVYTAGWLAFFVSFWIITLTCLRNLV